MAGAKQRHSHGAVVRNLPRACTDHDYPADPDAVATSLVADTRPFPRRERGGAACDRSPHWRNGSPSHAFRQLAPIIATAQALQFLSGEDIAPITAALADDTPRITPLKTISRWVSGDPLMLATSGSMLAAALSEVVNAVYEYINLALLLDANGVFFGAAKLRTHRAALLRGRLRRLATVDAAAISVASLSRAERSDWTRADISLLPVHDSRHRRRKASSHRRRRTKFDHAARSEGRSRHRLEHVGQDNFSANDRC